MTIKIVFTQDGEIQSADVNVRGTSEYKDILEEKIEESMQNNIEVKYRREPVQRDSRSNEPDLIDYVNTGIDSVDEESEDTRERIKDDFYFVESDEKVFDSQTGTVIAQHVESFSKVDEHLYKLKIRNGMESTLIIYKNQLYHRLYNSDNILEEKLLEIKEIAGIHVYKKVIEEMMNYNKGRIIESGDGGEKPVYDYHEIITENKNIIEELDITTITKIDDIQELLEENGTKGKETKIMDDEIKTPDSFRDYLGKSERVARIRDDNIRSTNSNFDMVESITNDFFFVESDNTIVDGETGQIISNDVDSYRQIDEYLYKLQKDSPELLVIKGDKCGIIKQDSYISPDELTQIKDIVSQEMYYEVINELLYSNNEQNVFEISPETVKKIKKIIQDVKSGDVEGVEKTTQEMNEISTEDVRGRARYNKRKDDYKEAVKKDASLLNITQKDIPIEPVGSEQWPISDEFIPFGSVEEELTPTLSLTRTEDGRLFLTSEGTVLFSIPFRDYSTVVTGRCFRLEAVNGQVTHIVVDYSNNINHVTSEGARLLGAAFKMRDEDGEKKYAISDIDWSSFSGGSVEDVKEIFPDEFDEDVYNDYNSYVEDLSQKTDAREMWDKSSESENEESKSGLRSALDRIK